MTTLFTFLFYLAGSICVFVGLMAIRQKITLDDNNQLLTTTLAEIELRKQQMHLSKRPMTSWI